MVELLIYVYSCSVCPHSRTEVIKSAKQIDDPELCKSSHEMERVIVWGGQMNVPSFEPQFNPAFGKIIHSKRQIQDEVRRTRDEQGVELVEMGNERVKPKASRQEYDWDGVGRELHQRLKNG